MIRNNNELSDSALILLQFALAVGSFAIGTSEFVAMGVLPEMAKSTSVDIATAGYYIVYYALGVVIGAPILAVITAKIPKKTLLICLMLFYAAANALVSLSFSYFTLLLSRGISGLPHGIYFGTATLVASSLVPLNERSKAIGNVMLGLTIAVVVGAPLATYMGQLFSWRVVFLFVSFIALLSAILIYIYLPNNCVFSLSTPVGELQALKDAQVWIILLVVAIGAAGLFSVFSYIKVILMESSGYSLNQVPIIMPLMGVGMVLGNIIGPRIAKRLGINKAIIYCSCYSIIVYALFTWLCNGKVGAAIGCVLIGMSFASMPSMQAKIFAIAKDAKTLSGALIQSAYNVANCLGAWLGGLLISYHFSYGSTGVLGSILTLTGLVIFVLGLNDKKIKKS